MRLHVKGIVVVIAAALLVSVAVIPAIGQVLAFNQFLKTTIPSGRGTWYSCGSVTLNAPAVGYVVVTASGMAWFNYVYATLTLTLAQSSAVKGPWIFTLSPGVQPYQTYSARLVFPVYGGLNTFYLNAQSNNGNGSGIGVQTGSLTAEWFPVADVQAADQAGTEELVPENANPSRN